MKELRAVAGEKDAGRKIKYFVRGDMQVSYGQFCAMKAANALLLNGAPVHADALLRPGDEIVVRLPDPEPGKEVLPEPGQIRIVYEDEDLYILDKEAPLACQCTPKQPIGTLENHLYAHFAAVPDFVFRPLNRRPHGRSKARPCLPASPATAAHTPIRSGVPGRCGRSAHRRGTH